MHRGVATGVAPEADVAEGVTEEPVSCLPAHAATTMPSPATSMRRRETDEDSSAPRKSTCRVSAFNLGISGEAIVTTDSKGALR